MHPLNAEITLLKNMEAVRHLAQKQSAADIPILESCLLESQTILERFFSAEGHLSTPIYLSMLSYTNVEFCARHLSFWSRIANLSIQNLNMEDWAMAQVVANIAHNLSTKDRALAGLGHLGTVTLWVKWFQKIMNNKPDSINTILLDSFEVTCRNNLAIIDLLVSSDWQVFEDWNLIIDKVCASASSDTMERLLFFMAKFAKNILSEAEILIQNDKHNYVVYWLEKSTRYATSECVSDPLFFQETLALSNNILRNCDVLLPIPSPTVKSSIREWMMLLPVMHIRTRGDVKAQLELFTIIKNMAFSSSVISASGLRSELDSAIKIATLLYSSNQDREEFRPVAVSLGANLKRNGII